MCGIAGFTFPTGLGREERTPRHAPALQAMTAALRHRGPDDQRGLLLDGVALGHARLAILDLSGGAQPMRDPATGVSLVFNGEIFNHLELRRRLDYPFRTSSDTEVLLASYLARGMDCVEGLNGQFAFAIWDPRSRELWLARDRVGICPLFYASGRHGLAFASEAKALFASELVAPELDLHALRQTLELWAPVEGRSAFVGIQSLPPGTVARWHEGELSLRRYWELDLGDHLIEEHRPRAELEEELAATLADAVRLRLRADVPVAAYLSGGLDSTLLCGLAGRELRGLQTFSVAFTDSDFDERGAQHEAATSLQTDHASVELQTRDVAEELPAVVWHAEQLLLRAAPGPLLHLSRLVRNRQTKVVLTGEGADELFWGYDIFKEALVRRFCARRPGSLTRARLFTRLYPWLRGIPPSPALLRELFQPDADPLSDPAYSHRIRWRAGARTARLLAPEILDALRDEDPWRSLQPTLPAAMAGWRPLARAQLLEMRTLLSGYLLSAQGDRMLLGNGVEGRFPYLDHRVIELAARIPDRFKLAGLHDKRILRSLAERTLPSAWCRRPKFPYRAPIASGLVGPNAPRWARELLAQDALRAVGLFDAAKVQLLVQKLSRAQSASEADAAAVMAVASGQLLASHFQAPVRPIRSQLAAVAVEAA